MRFWDATRLYCAPIHLLTLSLSLLCGLCLHQVNTDFSDSDIRGASMEDTSMDGANLKNAIAVGSYFSSSILDVATVENADFTDAQFPVKALPLLCERPDMKGTNPVTGADTRESAMCP